MRRLVAEAGLEGEIEVDSAGTAGWHAGDPPDPRAVAAAGSRGTAVGGRGRQVTVADLERFDLLVAMDRSNRDDLLELASDAAARSRVRLLRDGHGEDPDVPDPYYGGADGFDEVLDIVERCCARLLAEVRGEPAA